MSSVGGFELRDAIADGGMGVVFAAADPAGRLVAVKLLHRALRDDALARERILREAAALGLVAHPHVLAYIAHGVDAAEGPWIATELVRAPRLSELLRDHANGLDVVRATRIAEQVLAGLGALNGAGIFHRDIKADNVFVQAAASGDHALVFDLGASYMAGSPDLTPPGMVMGSLSHVAPERLMGAPADARSDVWALGALLYRCLTRHHPFEAPSASELMGVIANDPPTPIAAYRRDVPDALEAVMRRAMAKDASARYPDAASMARALRAAVP